MMVDEAIKIYEMGAKRTWNGRLTIYAEQCQQMAEWLKDYKRLLEQEPCEDCISRKQAIELFVGWWSDLLEYHKEDECFDALLKTLPPVTPQPKMGKWIYNKEEDSYRCNLCTFPCHKDNLGAIPTNYCAGCGAVMEV